MEEDLYKTLEVARTATKAEIEKAYRRLARKYHPDLNPDDKKAKQKFQQVQQAYEVLGDPQKREMYDRYGANYEAVQQGGGWARGPGGGSGAGAEFGEIDLNDLFGRFGGGGGGGSAGGFEQIFRQFGGGRAGGRGPRRAAAPAGQDIEAEVEIPFHTSVLGGETQITLSHQGHPQTLSVKIPAGIEEGKKIRLRGKGDPGLGGEPGDLLIKVRIAAHPHFRRRGAMDLEVDLPVTLAEALLGATVDVPTPYGTISLKVPPGTSSGQRLRIKGHGVRKDDRQGDLFAEVQIIIPKTVDPLTADAIRELDRKYQLSPRGGLRW